MSLKEFVAKHGHVIDGKWYPRVTAITQVISKPHLYRYYAKKESYRAAEEDLQRAAKWGSVVHEIIEDILKGKNPYVPLGVRPSIEAFKGWLAEHTIKVFDKENHFERLIVHPEYLYSGHLDVFLEIDGVRGILDIKTSGGIWKEYGLQTAAYLEAFNLISEIPAETRWILRVDQMRTCKRCGKTLRDKEVKNIWAGSVKLKDDCSHDWSQPSPVLEFKELSSHEEDFKIFLAARQVWEWQNKEFLQQIPEYPGPPRF